MYKVVMNGKCKQYVVHFIRCFFLDFIANVTVITQHISQHLLLQIAFCEISHDRLHGTTLYVKLEVLQLQ